jgi:hypothetical protein
MNATGRKRGLSWGRDRTLLNGGKDALKTFKPLGVNKEFLELGTGSCATAGSIAVKTFIIGVEYGNGADQSNKRVSVGLERVTFPQCENTNRGWQGLGREGARGAIGTTSKLGAAKLNTNLVKVSVQGGGLERAGERMVSRDGSNGGANMKAECAFAGGVETL